MASESTAEARELLLDLKRAFWLPPFAAERVRNVVETIAMLYDESRNLQRLQGIDMRSREDSVAPISRMLTMLRNRDMLLCYLRHRMERVEKARWDVAGKLPDEALDVLSVNEQRFDREYADLLSAYQTDYDLDLTRDAKPPADLYINVLVKEEVGAFIGPESGASINLKEGDTIFLRRGEVEHLIRQGTCAHIG